MPRGGPREMLSIPLIQEPILASTEPTVTTPTSSSSKLRSLFHWRKSSTALLCREVGGGYECDQKSPRNRKSGLPQVLSPRSRSENMQNVATGRALHSSEQPLSTKKEKILIDPPPLAQVHSQTILNATLESPVSFPEQVQDRQESLSSADHSALGLKEESVEVKRFRKRTNSGATCCKTRAKTFFLVNGPYVLQYDGDGTGDALPEKILVLNKDSVAFASDAVPGCPWVVQISKYGSLSTKSRPATLKPSWSRLTLRQPEDKRSVNVLLLVFDDLEELRMWLSALRKEIEHLGGMKHRPDAEEDRQAWKDDLLRRFVIRHDNEPGLNRSSASCNTPPIASLSTASYQGPQIMSSNRPFSTQSSTSSGQTSTSLDRLRDSVTSDSYTPTLATSSGDCSTSSTSPTCDYFPSIKSVTANSKSDLSLRTFLQHGGSAYSQSRTFPAGQSLLERRKVSVDSLQLASAEEPRAYKILPALPSNTSVTCNDCSLPRSESLQSFHTGGLMNKTVTISSEGVLPQECAKQDGNDADRSSRKSSLTEMSSKGPKARYSLFPARPRTESVSGPLTSPVTSSQSEMTRKPQIPSNSEKEDCSKPTASMHGRSRSRTVTLELRQHRISTLLALGEHDLPQRSPAVMDDMILSNFGVAIKRAPASPLPDTQVPGLADLVVDLDFLKTPYRKKSQSQDLLPRAMRMPSLKRISSTHSDGAATLSRAPAGPPPVGPLPAVPPNQIPYSSRNSCSSQKSQINQPSHLRRRTAEHQFQSGTTKDTGPASQLSYGVAISEPRRVHRRTISSSLDGPQPLIRVVSKCHDTTTKVSRSRSRGRRQSNNQTT